MVGFNCDTITIMEDQDLWACRHRHKTVGPATDDATSSLSTASSATSASNEHAFDTLDEARDEIERWTLDYHNGRPHDALGDMTPEEFALAVINSLDPKLPLCVGY